MKYIYSFLIRVILCFVPISFFNAVLIPATVLAVAWLLPGSSIAGNIILFQGFQSRIVEACVAGFAFYLIWVLMLLTKDVRLRDRVGIFVLGMVLMFSMNVIRILILIGIYINLGVDAFNSVHFLFWQVFSGVYVAIVWISLVSMFKLKGVPAWEDIKTLWGMIRK